MSIELNDLTPLFLTSSVQSIKEPHFNAKFYETDFSDVNFKHKFPFRLANFNGISIKNCLHLQTLIDFLTKDSFVSYFNNQASIFILKIDIADLTSINPLEIQKFIEKIDKKIFLISMESSRHEQVQIFWKFRDDKIFYTRIQKEISKLAINFLASSMRLDGHCGFSTDFQSTETILEVDKLMLRNLSRFNLLMIAAEHGDSNAVNLCLKSGFNVNEKVHETTAVDLAWNNQHFHIVLDLLKANSCFPKNFEIKLATKEIKEFMEIKRLEEHPLLESESPIKDCKGCSKHQIRIIVALIIAFPIIIWFGIRLKIKPLNSCKDLTNEQLLKIFESTVDFQGVNVIFGDLFGRKSSDCEHLRPQEIAEMLNAFGPPTVRIHEKVNISTKFYVGRAIKPAISSSDNSSGMIYDFVELTKLKLFLLSDKGGSGKSTYFNHMAWKLKQRFPLKWISYVDLKQHIHVLQDVPKTDANLTTLVDFMSLKLLNLTSKVEIDVFSRKFLSNETIILWDGVGEVLMEDIEEVLRLNEGGAANLDAKYNNKMVNGTIDLIKVISMLTDNKQWVATSPHLGDEFVNELGIEAYNFVKFNEDDKKEYVEKYVRVNGLEYFNASKVVEEFNGFKIKLIKLLKDLEEVLDNFDTNPQILQIICDFYSKNITFGNGLSLFRIYETYFHEILAENYESSQHDSQKMDLITKTIQHFVMNQILRYPVYNIINGDYDSNCRDLEIHNLTIYTNVNIILSLGVVHKNGDEIIFEDQIFRDFFIAQYLFDNIWNPNNGSIDEHEAERRLQFLFYVFFAVNTRYRIVTEHMIGFIDSYEDQVDASFNPVYSDLLCHSYPNLLLCLASKFADERIGIATKFFKKDIKIIDCLWNVNENRTFFHRFLELATKADQVADMKAVVDDNFSSEDARKVLAGKYQSANFLSILWQHRWNANYSNAITNATGYAFDLQKLQSIQKFDDFMKFLINQKFSNEEMREFFYGNINIMDNKADKVVFEKYANELLSSKDYKDILDIWSVRNFVMEFEY
ncbi:hypothetical protein ACKWTF_015296 [Chironomus riparius]